MVQLWTKLTTVNCSLSDVEEAKSPRTQYGYSVVYFLNHLGFSCFWHFLKSVAFLKLFDVWRLYKTNDRTGRIYGKILTKFSISSFEYDYNKQRWAKIIKIVNPCILRSKFYRKSKSRFIFFFWVLTWQSDISGLVTRRLSAATWISARATGIACSVKGSFF